MNEELQRLRQLTETLTGNGFLRDQASEWEYALNAIPDLIYIINTKYHVKFVNEALASRLDACKEDLIDQVCYEAIRGMDTPPKELLDIEDIDSSIFMEDVYIPKLSGWFDITVSPIFTQSHKLIGFICVLQDITDKKQVMSDLVVREATLDTIFNAAPIGLGLIERGTRIIKAVNRAMLRITGFGGKELVGKNVRILYPSDEEYERVGREKYTHIDEKGFGEAEAVWVKKDGTSINVYLKTAKIGSNGDLVFTVVDITHIKDTEQRMSLFIDQTPLAVIGWDLDFTISSWNQGAEDIFGFTEEEAVGRHSDLIVPVTEKGWVDNVWKELIDNTGGLRSGNKNKTKAGQAIFCEWYNTPLVNSSGQVIGAMSLVMDVTTIKLNEDRLTSALKLATMNHEDEAIVIEYALEEAVRLTGSKVGYLHFVNSQDDSLDRADLSLFRWSKGTVDMCTAEKVPHYPLTEAGCWADSVRNREPVVHNDYESLTSDEGKKGLPEGHAAIVRHMSVPVLVKDRVVAVAGVGNKETDYDESDVRQLSLFMNSMWDIVQRIRAEKKAKEMEKKFEVILNNVVDAIWTTDKDLNFTFINPAIKELMGYEPEEWIGKNVSDLSDPEDFEFMIGKVVEALETPDFKETDFISYMRNKAGEKVKLHISAKPLFDCNKELIGFQGITRVLK